MTQIVVANFSKAEKISLSFKGALLFETCLRQMFIFTEEGFNKAKKNEVFKGALVLKNLEAIEYIVKVISGLESPILGETEVLGQFKKQILPQVIEKSEFKSVIDFALNITKFVRTKHLKSLGSQTYGSMVRRVLKAEKNVMFIGSGVLASSILPWVYKSKICMMAVRNLDKFKSSKLIKTYDKVKAYSLAEPLNYDFPLSVVVCAPISSKKLEVYLKNANVKTVIDLRENSESDELCFSDSEAKVFRLKEVFTEISQKESRRDQILFSVNKDIKDKIDSNLVKYRPFGWDDLCV